MSATSTNDVTMKDAEAEEAQTADEDESNEWTIRAVDEDDRAPVRREKKQ